MLMQFLVTLLTGFGTWAQARGSTPQCVEIFNSHELLSEPSLYQTTRHILKPEQPTRSAQQFENFFREKVSPGYEKAWSNFLGYYRELFSEILRMNGVELAAMKRFGFSFSEYSVVMAPTFQGLIKNYEDYLDELKVPESRRIRPVVTLRNKETGELLLIRRGIDPWPVDINAWSFPKTVRLKAREMAKNISEGRFPVFSEGLHVEGCV